MAPWLAWLAWLAAWLALAESTHIFTLDEDFSRLKTDPRLAKYAEEVLQRLRTFKVAVHPRIRLFYHLLKRRMADYAQRAGDSLYAPYVYRQGAGAGDAQAQAQDNTHY